MAAFVVLEDGRSLWGSTVIMANVYHYTALAIGEPFPQFKLWLDDMADRPAPFMDFDLRGLPEDCREEFHRAARRARDELANQLGVSGAGNSILQTLDRLVSMRERIDQGEHPLALSDDDHVHIDHGHLEDINEIWGG